MSDQHLSLPSNLDAERGLLGSMLLNADVIDSLPNMEADAFHLPIHQLIFETLHDMRSRLKPIDLITVTAELRKRDLDGLENVEFILSDLVVFVPTSANWDHYADLVHEEHIKRKVIAGCVRNERLARGHKGSADDLLNEVEQSVMEMRGSGKTDDALKPVKKFVDEAVNSLEAVFKNRGKPIGLTTGFVDLDRMTGGLKPTLLYVVAGRPSMGKTVLAVQIATHNALAGIPVALYSMEMSGAELAERMIGTQSSINLQRWRDGFLEKGDLPRIAMSSNEIAKSKLWIDETPSLSIMDLRARARRAVTKRGAKLIVIDYMQQMRAPSKRADFSRAAEVADISMGLKAMAKELRVPVIVCAQLNRENDGKRPALSNLRESGQIEQDADVAILIHRPFKDKELSDDDKADFSQNGEPAEAILAKQRNGPIGTVDLRFFGQFTRFESTTKKAFSNNPNERQKKK